MQYCELISGNYFSKSVNRKFIPAGVTFAITNPPANVPLGQYAIWVPRNGWQITAKAPDLTGRMIYRTIMTRREFLTLFTVAQRKAIKSKINGGPITPGDDTLFQYWEQLTESDTIDFNDQIVRRCLKYLKTSGILSGPELRALAIGFGYKRVG